MKVDCSNAHASRALRVETACEEKRVRRREHARPLGGTIDNMGIYGTLASLAASRIESGFHGFSRPHHGDYASGKMNPARSTSEEFTSLCQRSLVRWVKQEAADERHSVKADLPISLYTYSLQKRYSACIAMPSKLSVS